MADQIALQAADERSDVGDFLAGKRLGLTGHDGVTTTRGAVSALVSHQGLSDVVRILTGQLGIARINRLVQVFTVAGDTGIFLGREFTAVGDVGGSRVGLFIIVVGVRKIFGMLKRMG